MTDWWELPTNFSSGTEVNGVADLFVKYPSLILNNYFGVGITILIWLVSFGLSLASGTRKALMVSSFIAFIFSLYFVRLGALNLLVSVTLIGMTILGAIGSKSEGQY